MDFRGRLSQPSNRPAGNTADASNDSFAQSPASSGNSGGSKSGLFKIVAVLLLVVVIAALSFMLLTKSSGGSSQLSSVDNKVYQAVFLNNGQVYFGKISAFSKDSVELHDIYYLQSTSSDDSSASKDTPSISLVKLGCELHAPSDKMFINTEQVLFWENLTDGSTNKVAAAIKDYQTQNGDKLNCATTTQSSTNQAPSSSSTNSSSTTTGTGSTTGTSSTTKKP